jgi:hypothetical protein
VSRTLCALAAAVAVAASLLFTAAAGASSSDRNRDRIPDRWEKQHHLSLKVKQTRRDQDHDGLNNLGEYRSQTDPRDGDSDDDGIGDFNENAGTVASFTGGVLTITLGKGGTLSGVVTSATEIECESSPAPTTPTASKSDDDPGDDDDHGSSGNPPAGGVPSPSPSPSPGGGHDDGDDNQNDDDQNEVDDDQGNCGVEAFTAGRSVKEAELKAGNGQAFFEHVHLGA